MPLHWAVPYVCCPLTAAVATYMHGPCLLPPSDVLPRQLSSHCQQEDKGAKLCHTVCLGCAIMCYHVLSCVPCRRLMPGLSPAPQVPGGAEPTAQLSTLDSLCPPMPLDVFRVYDVSEISQVRLFSTHPSLPQCCRLTRTCGLAPAGGSIGETSTCTSVVLNVKIIIGTPCLCAGEAPHR